MEKIINYINTKPDKCNNSSGTWSVSYAFQWKKNGHIIPNIIVSSEYFFRKSEALSFIQNHGKISVT